MALAPHPAALRVCEVMAGEGGKGDPLTHQRLTLRAVAQFVAADDPARPAFRAHGPKGHPKAALCVDFAFVRLVPQQALLNGGFALTYLLSAADIT